MALAAEITAPARFADVAARLKAMQSDDLAATNDVILEHLASDISLIPQVASHLIAAGGKRLRPLICLAAADICGARGQKPRFLAGAVELIHAATLLHDDVVDDSALRRGLKTANIVFGNKESVLVGDFLFARAFALMVKTESLDVLDILSRASCTIAEGEVLQLTTEAELETSRATYISVVSAKTAALFEASARAGAMVAGAGAKEAEALGRFGLNFGIAYQLVDDTLDYEGQADNIGKSAGDDFREGKMTLPVIHAIARARDDDERAFWHRTISELDQKVGDFERAQSLIARDGLIEVCLAEARDYAAAAADALSAVRDTPLRRTLEDLALSSAARQS
ncbi:MAG: polyprenyl synthetase family protein [Pseudomonadota bacterium]